MADLDTASKRRSGAQLLKPFFSFPPEPTLVVGDIDQGDRQHFALLYSGILAAGAGGLAGYVLGAGTGGRVIGAGS